MNAFIRYLPVFLLFGIWEVAARLGWISTDVLPAVSSILAYWWHLLRNGDLLTHVGASMFRESTGLALSIVVGMVLGIAMAISRRTERVIQPFITFFYPLPKSALIPIIIVWFGLGHSSQIAVIFLGCLLPIVLSSFNGAKGVETALVWSARSLGATSAQIVRQVVVRAAMPEILAGIRVALALSFVLLVSAEMVGGRQGMGFLISFLGEQGDYAGMFAVVFTVVAIGFAADRLYLAFTGYALRWREA
jgi:NitT/TauT family transport system permease protein